MAIIRVIPAGDLKFTINARGKRALTLVSGASYVKQKIGSKLRFFLGEWFRNTAEGVPWVRDVLGLTPDLQIVRSIYLEAFGTIPEIASTLTLNLSFDRTTRSIAVEFDVKLADGSVLSVRQPSKPFIFQLQRFT